ncbi:MAG TPA: XdhC family protein [Anaerolineales bacterium]|nr:XdhC family protein [Anaerolineales bacterium]
MADRIFDRLAEAERKGEPVALCTVIRAQGSVPRHTGSKMLVFEDGSIEGSIGGGEMESRVIAAARQALADGQARITPYSLSDPSQGDPGVCGGEVEVFVDPIGNKPAVVVFGGGHVGRAVVHLAHWLGFRTVIADDRAEYASRESAPEADEHIVCPLGELAQRTRIDAMTYLVLATRGVGIDVEGLPALLDSPAAYIGIIGSRRRWETASAELEGRGVPRAGLERIHSPMGLELNAETPEEIAVSILSEIILVRRGGTGESMRHAPRPKKESRPS